MSYEILRGDCLAVLKTLPDNSFDSICTDPPYELGFMGKAWDATGIANSVEMWREALRVLKPGGYLLAFSGSRTYHRMTCAIEDAGFEVRDQIMWVYGSGFPKSLDVSKAIDKANGNPLAFRQFAEAYAQAVASSALTHTDVDKLLGIKSSSCYWARSDHRGGMPPRHHWKSVKQILSIGDSFDRLYDEAERAVVGTATGVNTALSRPGIPLQSGASHTYDITAPATEAARQWDGWGTALKPAHEPICVARKPLIGTVAANVLAHGVGALNIDGCRVPAEKATGWGGGSALYEGGLSREGGEARMQDAGRWPANLIHDGSDEVLAAFPDAKGQQGATAARSQGDVYGAVNAGQIGVDPRNDTGSAARFFYCAKASKSDRGPGNVHPTVKPLALMRYLLRLVTPPGGRSLDIFAGSGSTIVAGLQEGFVMTGIELTPEYADIAERRAQEEYLGDLI